MKKGIKITLNILLVLAFIFSAAFNILIHGSSYGTLIVSHSDEKLLAITSAEYLNFYPNFFLGQKEAGVQIYKETREDTSIIKDTYSIHFSEEYNMTASISKTTQEADNFTRVDSYYKDQYLYTSNDTKKTKTSATPNTVTYSILSEITTLLYVLSEDIEEKDTKAKIDFSFSPFYFIGIKYTINSEESDITFKYDLNGTLRKISIEYESGKKEYYEISHKNKEVKLPNLEEFK